MVMTEVSGSKTFKINSESQPNIVVGRLRTWKMLNDKETERLFYRNLSSICTISIRCGKKKNCITKQISICQP